MRAILAVVGLAVVSSVLAQATQTPVPAPKRAPFKLQIRKADPWAVKAMLEGMLITQPEYSTMPGWPGFGNQVVNALFKGGKLIVNPTDNSIWFIPDRT